MATIRFRGLPRKVYNMDETVAYMDIQVPVFHRKHCDMSAFRTHPKYGGLANSDLFDNVLARIRRDVAPGGWWRMDRLPENVKATQEKFFTLFEIEV